VDCNAKQEQLSLLLDGETAALEQADLFAHLGACADCRDWFDTLARLRGAARRDREEIAGGADDLRPPLPSLSALPSRRPAAQRIRGAGWTWRLRVPLAAALAFALLAAGALLGARWPLLAEGAGAIAARGGRAPVVVICSLPDVTVFPQGVGQ